ncbi:DUF2737 family protein [Salmonella enterica subsp. enterica serovar Kentucky]|nr:DUF2737 family protein [Salmonella enterica subsp. enterica serovar Kentucky]
MFDQYDYQQYGTTTAAPKYDKAAKPRNLTPEQVEAKRRELINRNSFGSVNYNKYLNRLLEKKND